MELDAGRRISFPRFPESNGVLTPIEYCDVPFEVKRIFYINNTMHGDIRGDHAHKKCHQMLVCLNGECEVQFESGNTIGSNMLQSSDSKGLLIPAGTWCKQQYFNQAILMVLCSELYDPEDYITDKKEFLSWNS